MKKIRIFVIALFICGMFEPHLANADGASKVTVLTSEGDNISLKNSFGGEVEKSINGLFTDTEDNERPHGELSRVLTVRSESIDMAVSDIYIRISADKKRAVNNAEIEITDSYGNTAEISELSKTADDGTSSYIKDYYLGSFNSKSEFETRMYTVVASDCEDVDFSIVSVSQNNDVNDENRAECSIKKVGNGAGEVLPGEYRLTVSDQVKLISADGSIVLYKAAGTKDETVVLNEGDTIEFCADVYLMSSDADDSLFNRCLHLFSRTLTQAVPGYCTEIYNGAISVYDENGNSEYSDRVDYISGNTAYKLNFGSVEGKSDKDKENKAGTIKIKDGLEYTVGIDIGAGNYTGTGSGTVRVYDGDGYIKSVIRLKKESSDKTGVDSYVFKLSEGDVFVAEGSIKFEQTDN